MDKLTHIGGDTGTDLLKRIGGATWQAGIGPLAEVSRDMARMTVDFAYGEVMSRPGLDLLTRQCCTVAMLLVNGSATAQLKFHLHGLLNVGGTVDHAVELLTLATAMAGFPAAIGSIGVLRDVVSERRLVAEPVAEGSTDDRWAKGVAAMCTLVDCAPDEYTATYRDLAPEFARLTVLFQFGEVLGRNGLPDEVRYLVVIAMLAATGNRSELLATHIRGALAGGVASERIAEVFIQLAVYAGFPAALNAFAVLRQAAAAETDADVVPGGGSGSDDLTSEDRRRIGMETLAATSGGSGDAVVRSFADLAPVIGSMIVDHAYAEIFSDERLDPKLRELAAIATLASTMTEVDAAPLGVHIAAALTLGATRDEIVQTIVNVAPYRGYPTVQKALSVAVAAFDPKGA